MKLLLISDTHGELERTREVIRKHPNIDQRICLGDVGFDLKELDEFIIVKGNHDKQRNLPLYRILQIEGHKILCVHGDMFENETIEEVMSKKSEPGIDIMELCMSVLYRHISDYALSHECDCVLIGHTHIRVHEQCNGVTIINPGSLAYGMMGDDHSYAILDMQENELHVTFYELS